MANEMDLTIALGDYHRTRPILDGKVSVEGLRLNARPVMPGDACLKPLYEQFDVAEMEISWYLMARLRELPVIALPVFPLRMFIHLYIFCAESSAIGSPEDLKGRKVGICRYQAIVGLWARGILRDCHGVRPEDLSWVTSEADGDGYQIPAGIEVTVQTEDLESLLLRGEIDALISPTLPSFCLARDPRMRRVFRDSRSAVKEYFLQTGIFPITHTVVARQSLIEEHPWIASRLVDAFMEANKLCRRSYEYEKRLSYPMAAIIQEEEDRIFGKDPWAHGLAANKAALEKFLEYAKEQGYVPFQPEIHDLFAS